jgi:hypothetical protein
MTTTTTIQIQWFGVTEVAEMLGIPRHIAFSGLEKPHASPIRRMERVQRGNGKVDAIYR